MFVLQSLYSAVDNLKTTKADREQVEVEVGGVSSMLIVLHKIKALG